jgi:FkbM family methyltransferase
MNRPSIQPTSMDQGRRPRAHSALVPILGGKLRGLFWAPFSGGKLLRILLGTYEREQTELFVRHIRPGDVVFDVGAHVGYYTLLSARLLAGEGRVVSFEPDPGNVFFLRRHVAANRLKLACVYEAAVGAFQGTVKFSAGTGSGTGHLAEDGRIDVRICRLDDVVAEQGANPTHIKIDVEGAELQVLQGGRETLIRARPIIFLSTHGSDVHAACRQFLSELGYRFHPILGDDVDRSPELLCVPGEITFTDRQ